MGQAQSVRRGAGKEALGRLDLGSPLAVARSRSAVNGYERGIVLLYTKQRLDRRGVMGIGHGGCRGHDGAGTWTTQRMPVGGRGAQERSESSSRARDLTGKLI